VSIRDFFMAILLGAPTGVLGARCFATGHPVSDCWSQVIRRLSSFPVGWSTRLRFALGLAALFLVNAYSVPRWKWRIFH